MNPVQRFAWLLLGLLVLAGVAHAPLHADEDSFGEECSLMALCSGAVVLLICGAALVFASYNSTRPMRRLFLVAEQVSTSRIVRGSRGPPCR